MSVECHRGGGRTFSSTMGGTQVTSPTAGLTHTAIAMRRWLAGLIALACTFGLLLSASPALATPEFSFVGELAPSGGSFGSLEPNSVAVSDVSGDRFVADSSAGVVYVFDAAGNQVAVWDGSSSDNSPGVPGGAFGQVVSVAANARTGEVYVVDVFNAATSASVIDEFDENGKYLGQIAHHVSFAKSVAVDQATGEVYLLDPTNAVIDIFSGEGAYLRKISLSQAPGGFFYLQTSLGLAVNDLNGHVYVPDAVPLERSARPAVYEFDATGKYVKAWTGANTPSGLFDEGSLSVAADGVTGNVYVTDATDAVTDVFDVSGAYLERLSYPYGEARGTAVDPASGMVYVSDNNPGAVDIFAPPIPEAPTVGDVSIANLTASSADLKTQIEPDLSDTQYRFEYGETTSYGTSVPAPEGDVGAGNAEVTVSQHVEGLRPETLYHYRVVVHNTLGTVTSGDHTFITYETSRSTGETCPNAQYRVGYAALLPECRAYEQVTSAAVEPHFETFFSEARNIVNEGEPPPGRGYGVMASTDGNRIAFDAGTAPPGAVSYSESVFSIRGPHGWSTMSPVPPQSTSYGVLCMASVIWYSVDITRGVALDNYQYPECSSNETLLPGEPSGVQNVLVQNLDERSYRLVNVTPSGVRPADAWFQGASDDLSHLVFEEPAKLTANAPEGDDLYEWVEGHVHLVTVLPDDSPVVGRLANSSAPQLFGVAVATPQTFTHAVSSDGGRVFFYANGNLYVRVHADREQSSLDGTGQCAEPERACTYQVDASKHGGSGGGGRFMWASADGSRVFFTDEAQLTNGASATAGEPDMYEYNVDTGDLSDLTAGTGQAANVIGVSGAAEDGSYVYFVADGALTGQPNSNGDSAQAGQPNLYVVHNGGRPVFIAALDAGTDSMNWLKVNWEQEINITPGLTARVSPNGRFVVFNSLRSLTGYNNAPASPGKCNRPDYLQGAPSQPCQEIFLYDAAKGLLRCVSCDPTGARPTEPASIRGTNFPYPSIVVNYQQPFLQLGYLQRFLVNDGRVFFDTASPLVPSDTNGAVDVYEYDQGRLSLLSTATSSSDSYFYDASPDGNNVFFVSPQQLPSGAGTATYFIYDARVDGGFPEPAAATACSEEDCKGAVAATPTLSVPSSQTFVGQGNPFSAPAPVSHKTKHAKRKHGKKRKRRKKRHATGRGHGNGRTSHIGRLGR
jgi:hypothetical protein